MKYNTAKDELVIPEYGRHIQNLIQHCKTIENKEERQAMAERIVELMKQMHPQNRNIDDYRDKLWKHFFRIANYDIDVETPTGVRPNPEDEAKQPERIAYPIGEAKFRHYGHNVQQLIKKALTMEEGPIREGFVAVIGSYMKLAYKTWNKEYYVSDDIIKTDLLSLSNNQLVIKDNVALDNLSDNRRRKSSNGRSGSSHYQNGGKSKNRGRKRK